MFRTVVLLLTLTACTTGGPASYRQAAAPGYVPVQPPPVMTPGYFPGTPPGPVYTPSGAGLPGERVPGQVAPEVPRSPNRRVLPATGEPGVWAADPVLASVAVAPPEIAGVPIVLPKDRLGRQPVPTDCAAAMDKKLTDDDRAIAQRFPEWERRCLAASLYAHCVQKVAETRRSDEARIDKLMRQSGRLRGPARAVSGPDDAERAADLFRRQECKGLLSPPIADILSRILDDYDANWQRNK